MFQTGRRQPNKPSRKPPDPGPALWKCSLMSSGWCGWPGRHSPLWSTGHSPSPICSSVPWPHPWCSQDPGDTTSSWSCSCSWSTLLSKCPPSLRVESKLRGMFPGLMPPNTESSSWPGICRGTGSCVGGARSVIIWGAKLDSGTWGGWGWRVGELDFFVASPTTVSLSSSFSFPTNRLGQEVHESTSGELPMVSRMCLDCPVEVAGTRPNALARLSAGDHLQEIKKTKKGGIELGTTSLNIK